MYCVVDAYGGAQCLNVGIMELNLKKLIRFQTTAGDTTILLNEQEDWENLPSYQRILLEFLSDASDGIGRISIEDLKQYIKDNRDPALNFRKSFEGAVEDDFSERVKSSDAAKSSRIRLKYRLIFSVIAGILAVLIHIISTLDFAIELGESLQFGLEFFISVVVIELIIHFWRFIFRTSCYVLDQQGEDDLALWRAFRRFLDDFTTFEEKELPEFSVWREYMVYAVAMGNSQKVAKALAVKYPEAVSAGTDIYDDDMYRWMQDTDFYDAMDSIGREVAEVKAPTSSGSSDSNWSDSDGGGGGFSDSDGGSDSGSGGDAID